jgi:glycosyltransferase involved in cell wall biosynthesis
MRILVWHVHGSWATAFVQGPHEYLIPVLPDRGEDGRGRARTWTWPANAIEVTPEQLRDEHLDAIVLQRPHELELARRWTGRTPGVDLPAVYVEHNAPEPHPVLSRHPLADRIDIPLAHVTHFNRMFWDSGRAPTTVIEHGVVDPGELYTGELARAAVVINEPQRRGRMVGTDLLAELAEAAPIDHFGMTDSSPLPAGVTHAGDLGQQAMHRELARRRVYLHPNRWTSLGLSLIESMHLGLPVVGLCATEAAQAVPIEAGLLSNDPRRLRAALREFVHEPEAARLAGKAARTHALERYGLPRSLHDWNQQLQEVTR